METYSSNSAFKSRDNNILDVINKENKCFIKKPITIGKCSRFYLYILYSALFKFLSLIILGRDAYRDDGIGLLGFCPTFYNFNFIQSIYIYIGYIILGIIIYKFKDKVNEDNQGLLKNKITIQINYIYNQPLKNVAKNKRTRIFLVVLAFIFYIEVKKVLYIQGFQFFNFWTIEIVFMFLFMKKYFIIDFYRHHKVSIFFNVITCSALLLTASFLPTSLLDENNGNSYQNINKKLGSYFYCVLFIFIFVILSFIYCFSRTNIKILLQIHFISPFLLIFFLGITGLIVSSIASIVSYYIDYSDNLFTYFSAMKAILDDGNYYKFYGEIFLATPLYIFSNFMEITFEILTIYYLDPFYVLMTNNLYYGITELITFLLNITEDTLKNAHFLIAEFSEAFAFLSYMVYLEMIELHFCGLDNNIKKKIIAKGEHEFRTASSDALNIEMADEENDEESDCKNHE